MRRSPVRAVDDPAATNVARIVISGTRRLTPKDVISMPAFGLAYSDTEIATVVNYVTTRFGSAPSIQALELSFARPPKFYRISSSTARESEATALTFMPMPLY
jgi:hypothetical protein